MHHYQVSLGGDGVVFEMLNVWCERRGEDMIITPHGKDRDHVQHYGSDSLHYHVLPTYWGKHNSHLLHNLERQSAGGVFFLNSVFIIIFLIEKYKYKGPAALHGWIMEFL